MVTIGIAAEELHHRSQALAFALQGLLDDCRAGSVVEPESLAGIFELALDVAGQTRAVHRATEGVR